MIFSLCDNNNVMFALWTFKTNSANSLHVQFAPTQFDRHDHTILDTFAPFWICPFKILLWNGENSKINIDWKCHGLQFIYIHVYTWCYYRYITVKIHAIYRHLLTGECYISSVHGGTSLVRCTKVREHNEHADWNCLKYLWFTVEHDIHNAENSTAAIPWTQIMSKRHQCHQKLHPCHDSNRCLMLTVYL